MKIIGASDQVEHFAYGRITGCALREMVSPVDVKKALRGVCGNRPAQFPLVLVSLRIMTLSYSMSRIGPAAQSLFEPLRRLRYRRLYDALLARFLPTTPRSYLAHGDCIAAYGGADKLLISNGDYDGGGIMVRNDCLALDPWD